MSNFKRDYRLDDYEVAAFEAIVHQPGIPHTGRVVDELMKKGLVYDVDGNHYVYTHAKDAWRQWFNRQAEEPHGPGVKVWK